MLDTFYHKNPLDHVAKIKTNILWNNAPYNFL